MDDSYSLEATQDIIPRVHGFQRLSCVFEGHASITLMLLNGTIIGGKPDHHHCDSSLERQSSWNNQSRLFQMLQLIQSIYQLTMDFANIIPVTLNPWQYQFCQNLYPISLITPPEETKTQVTELENQLAEKNMQIQQLKAQLNAAKDPLICSKCTGSSRGEEQSENVVFHELPQRTVFRKRYECREEGCHKKYSSLLALRNHCRAVHGFKRQDKRARV